MGPGWIFFTVLGFFSGSVMYSYLIPKKLRGIDIRRTSSDGNPGGINAFRAAGRGIGLLCIALDVLKAALPVFAAIRFGGIRGVRLLPVAAAPVLGHAFSPFLGFHGGKAISAAFGALLGLWSVSRIVVILIVSVAFFHFLVVIRPDSLCVAAGILAALLASLRLEPNPLARWALLLVTSVVLMKTARNPNRGEVSVAVGTHVFRGKGLAEKFRRE